MGKTLNKFSKWTMFVFSLLASIVIGGLFINGTFLNIPILNLIPAAHQFVGWAIIIAGVILSIAKVVK